MHNQNIITTVVLLIIGALLNALFGVFLKPTLQRMFGNAVRVRSQIKRIDRNVILCLFDKPSFPQEDVYLHTLDYPNDFSLHNHEEAIRSLADQLSEKSSKNTQDRLGNLLSVYSHYFEGTLINKSKSLKTVSIHFEESGHLLHNDQKFHFDKLSETELKLKPNEDGLVFQFLPEKAQVSRYSKVEDFLTLSTDTIQVKEFGRFQASNIFELFLYRGIILGLGLMWIIFLFFERPNNKAPENNPPTNEKVTTSP